MTDAELLRKRAELEKLAEEYAHHIVQATDKFARIVNELRQLQKSGPEGMQLALEVPPSLNKSQRECAAVLMSGMSDVGTPTN